MLLLELDGDVIITRENPFSLNDKNICRLAKELADYWKMSKEKILLIHGGGNFTHVGGGQFSKSLQTGSEGKKPVSIKTWSMRKLNDRVLENLVDNNLPVFPLQTSSIVTVTNNLTTINCALLKKLVDLDYIPVLYGDIIPTASGGQVISEAIIAELIYEYFPINRIIVCSSMDGVPVNAQNPSMGFVSKINSENINQVLDNLGNSSLVNIKGAMQEELKIVYNVAVRAGVNAQIINGTKPGMLYQCLCGNESLGTFIEGQKK